MQFATTAAPAPAVEQSIAYAPAPEAPTHAPAVPAPWLRRVAAQLIDGLITSGLAVVFQTVLLGSASSSDGGASRGALIGALVVSLVVPALYAAILLSRAGAGNGQTLGKRAMGVRVVADDGPIGFGRALVRDGLFKPFVSPFTLGLDYLWPLWDKQRQALHDKAVATRVVRA